MARVRIGVVGLGFGMQHVRTLANMPDFELVAVADRRGTRAADCAAAYGAKAYGDGVEMMRRERLDAVSLCNSPAARLEPLQYAVDNGIAALVEKPWATDVEHGRRLVDLCAGGEAPVMAAFSFRFHPAVARLRRLIDEGELGRGWVLNAEYAFAWRPPADSWLWDARNGNGFFNENSCHLFDVVCHLMGRPVALTAEAGNFMGSPSEDGAAVSLRFADGGVAALTLGGIACAAHRDYPRLDLIAQNGQARLRGRGHVWEELCWSGRDGDETRQWAQPPEALGATRYTDAFAHFAACVRDGLKPEATPEDGLVSVALAMGLYESIRTDAKVRLVW